jgi:hypothetical protein
VGRRAGSAYRVVKVLARHEELLLRTVQEKVLGLGSADISQPVKAGLVMFLSFMIGAAIPLLPFLLASGDVALLVSWALSVGALLGAGCSRDDLRASRSRGPGSSSPRWLLARPSSAGSSGKLSSSS